MISRAPAIGIDLGTTQSCVAIFRNGNVEVIANASGSRLTPSKVAFTDNEVFIGEAATNQAKHDPSKMIFDVKRMIGRRISDLKVQEDLKRWPFKVIDDDGCPKVQLSIDSDHKDFFPEEISAFVLRSMKQTAETYLGETVNSAVITVPAYFDNRQRQATVDAGTLAGLNVLQIISEPTVAAIAYGLNKKSGKEQSIMIFDLGGGTFDVSILSIKEGIFTVKAIAGDTHLGGEDFNNRLIDHVVRECKSKYGLDVADNKKVLHRIRSECEKAKRALSISTNANIEVVTESGEYDFPIDRATFESLNMDFFEATIDCVKKALQDASMNKNAIDEVVLVGGSTRIPKIRELLQKIFNGKKLNETVNPDEAVAYGAAVHAAQLNNDSHSEGIRMMLIDVAPLSLGVSIKGVEMSIVIPRNTAIPTKKTERYVTMYDNQTAVCIKVYEGEKSFVEDNNLLGEFRLSNVKAAPAGTEKFDVTFSIDANGILNVSAVDIRSQNRKAITITNNGRLSKATIERMAEHAEKYFSEDHKKRTRNSVTLQLHCYCHNIRNFLTLGAGSKKISDEDKKHLLEQTNRELSWLKVNKAEEPEIYESRFQKIQNLCSSVIDKYEKGERSDSSAISTFFDKIKFKMFSLHT